jgi:hypothetical protein
LFAAGFIALLSAFAGRAAAVPEPSELSLRFQRGLVSIEAREISWAKLLEELSRTTGITLWVRLPLEGSVTASFRNVPLERALEQLFGREVNFLYVYNNSSARSGAVTLPSEAWIFGQAHAEGSRSFESFDVTVSPATRDVNESTANLLETFQNSPRIARAFAQRHPDPKVQRMAIAYLGEEATSEAIDVLFLLLQDRESSVRQTALEALGPLVQHHRPVRENLLKVLERSEDKDTRQLIADSLGVSLENIKPGQPIATEVLDDVAQ